MADFRRWIPALIVLALFTGLANAQIVIGTNTNASAGPLACTANVAVPPTVRAEGMTELVGDIVLTCTGGPALPAGATLPQANFTVFLNTQVTSRLYSGSSTSNGISEAQLLIDEPGSGLPGAVPAAIACPTPTSGCVATASGSGAYTGPNTFQGLVNQNSVTFLGVPIQAPVTGGFGRVFRITNIRANASGLGAGGATATQVIGSISISSSSSIPLSNPTQVVGFVSTGLVTSVRQASDFTVSNPTPARFPQCVSTGGATPTTDQSIIPINAVRFSENFANAFKTRFQGGNQATGIQNGTPTNQNVPGTINNNSESGLILFPGGQTYLSPSGSTLGTSTTANAPGVADFGTRLKAVFNNVPAGARLYVTVTNVSSLSSTTFNFWNLVSNPTTGPVAVLVPNELLPDSGGGGFPVPGTAQGTPGTVAEIIPVNGSATAVWEIIQSNPNIIESLTFGISIRYVASPSTNSPAAGNSTVNLSFAPTPPAFAASDGTKASTTLPEPRFADTSTAAAFFSINVCRTNLLFPFVTNQAGFDTGIAISNTSADIFGTTPQAGTCTLNFFGASAPAALNLGNVAAGTTVTSLASTMAPGFQGYVIAQCNFQFAHGYSFVSDLGARNLAMGYLALIIPDTSPRFSGFLANANTGEALAQ